MCTDHHNRITLEPHSCFHLRCKDFTILPYAYSGYCKVLLQPCEGLLKVPAIAFRMR